MDWPRRPIVSTPGLTRSKGRVSQAGNRSAAPSSIADRSPARRSASAVVGVATTIGRRPFSSAMAASTAAWPDSATASEASRRPRMPTTAGSDANIRPRPTSPDSAAETAVVPISCTCS